MMNNNNNNIQTDITVFDKDVEELKILKIVEYNENGMKLLKIVDGSNKVIVAFNKPLTDAQKEDFLKECNMHYKEIMHEIPDKPLDIQSKSSTSGRAPKGIFKDKLLSEEKMPKKYKATSGRAPSPLKSAYNRLFKN